MTEQLPRENIKLIVIDVDNTLLNSKSELSERNRQAISTAIEKGVRIMLATGKNYGACKTIIEELKIDTPGIFTQGLTIHEPNGILRHQQLLDNEIARRAITFAEDRGYAVVAYAQGRILARTRNPYIEELHTRWKDVQPEYIGPLQNSLGQLQFNKLVFISANDEKKIKALRWQLSTQINGNARLLSGGVSHMLELLPPGASKGNALRALLKELKIAPEDVLAIGDAENDIEMIKLAGIGVAVANAQQILKAEADYLTASHDEDGVAKAIERYVIGEPKKPEPVEETPSNTQATPDQPKTDEEPPKASSEQEENA